VFAAARTHHARMLKYIVIGVLVIVALVMLRRLFGRKPIEPVGRQRPKMITQEGGAVAAEIEGQELDIDPKVLEEIRQLSDAGRKIEAIKVLREATGLGLAEAKQIVESLDQIKK
jgi:ribosomal protein L7/L12